MSTLEQRFHWACGIEDTFIADPYPTTGKILDEYELTEHYENWKADFDRVQTVGVDSVRWGIPWYKVNPQKNVWDWTWIDEVLPYVVEEKKISVILDLMHYGTPLWTSYLDPDYPKHVLEYTAQVVERYGHLITMATPYNEPHTACEFCGNRGEWPPYLKGIEGYVRVFKAVMYGALAQTKYLQKHGIECIHVECSGGSWATEAQYEKQALIDRSVQAVYWDFLTGTFTQSHPLYELFLQNGITEADIAYFAQNKTTIDVMGVNYYPQFSYQKIYTTVDGTLARTNHQEWVPEFETLIRNRYEKYHVPIMITETSVRDDEDMKKRWLQESTASVLKLKAEGVPIIGYTWFPIIDMYDWDYRTAEGPKENFKARFGFWNHERRPNECVALYKEIIAQQRGEK